MYRCEPSAPKFQKQLDCMKNTFDTYRKFALYINRDYYGSQQLLIMTQTRERLLWVTTVYHFANLLTKSMLLSLLFFSTVEAVMCLF